MDFLVDHSDNEELQLIRYMVEESKGTTGAIYLFPINLQRLNNISLATIRSVLSELEERGLIEKLMTPNFELTEEQRLRREDEQDYYWVDLLEGFFTFADKVLSSADFFFSKKTMTTAEPSKPLSTPKRLKLKYDEKTEQLTYGDKSLQIYGVLQQEVCKQVFKKRSKPVAYDDILVVVDYTMTKQMRSVYDAVKNINEKIYENFGLSNALDPKGSKVRINKIYR